jgi:hypothetical protein
VRCRSQLRDFVDAGVRRVRLGLVDTEQPLDVSVVRDLLGVARSLYAAFVAMGPAYDDQRFRLRGIGLQLALAIEKAGQGGPGTFANRCACLIAEKAAADLGAVIDEHFPAKSLITATGARLGRKA